MEELLLQPIHLFVVLAHEEERLDPDKILVGRFGLVFVTNCDGSNESLRTVFILEAFEETPFFMVFFFFFCFFLRRP